METHARHMLVGFFTLVVAVAGFAFVYWLNANGGLGRRSMYRVQYVNSVAGLLVGSPVLFNGMRVGEVTALDLMPEKPDQIIATLAVDTGTPVRQDTKATIEFQGLTGSPAVALQGGAGTAAQASALIIAEGNAGESLSESARRTLKHIDTLISDNQDALRNTLSNLSKFSDALGRNSDHVDGIIAGIERMTGGNKPAAGVYDLTAIKSFPNLEKVESGQLFVPDPTLAFALGQDKIMVRNGDIISELSRDARWCDSLVTLFQSRLIQSFENAGYLGKIARPSDNTAAGYQLIIDIRRFELSSHPNPSAEVEFSAKLLNGEGHVIAAQILHSSTPADLTDATSAVSALNVAYGSAVKDLVTWTSTTLRGTPKRT